MGSAITSTQLLDAHFMPTPELLAKLPRQLWIYSFAAAKPNSQFTDADGAQLLTVMKTAWGRTLPAVGASAYGYVTLMGADESVFVVPPGPIPPSPTPGPFPPTPPGPVARSSAWMWLLGAAVVAGYAHHPKPGKVSEAYVRRLRR